MKRFFLLSLLALSLVSCEFSEEMTLREDGSGTMSILIDLNQLMAFGGSMMDTTMTKMDTIISMRQLLIEKKDSIAGLSEKNQRVLKTLENFSYHIKMDSEKSELSYEIILPFHNVNEVQNILSGLEQLGNITPKNNSMENSENEGESLDFIGLRYSFKEGIFKRDAYIKDKQEHKRQLDSLQKSAVFLESMQYSLKYNFPKPIKKVSDPAALLSPDKKSVTLTKPFLMYVKDPDVLDLEVVLEK